MQRQIMALRSDREAASISKGELALTIAHEMRRYLRSQYLSMKGTRINFDISIIYLTKLIRVSRGSWQPEFSVRRGTYASNGRVVQSIRQVGTETITWKRSTLPTT
ncbi:hypothetical protein BD310DRAFT_84488 [Dichomitus squalens]|uniref:Uncharacterized protein n=1 Tax=Dichomitus squalens TaxID=114155 RepID=A0A4Q9Q4F7_9APHY|nr:hypothetical protein BD310DRAFT_84488 [Dichomitus squalens]